MTRQGEPNAKLYQAVVDHPDDDAPRLAYADWFEENGDPDRALFIRLSCRLANLSEKDPEYVRLAPEVMMLALAAGPRWLYGRLESSTLRWRFLRGFPEHVVSSSYTALQKHHAHVFSFPVRRVGFFGLRSVARLAASPLLGRIRELDLSDCRLGDEGVRQLAISPHLRQLTWLTLSTKNLGAAGVEALAGLDLPQLRSLDLSSSRSQPHPIGPLGAAALARSPMSSRLTYLNLECSQLGDEGLRALADSPYLRELTELHLGDNGITATGIAAAAQRRAWPRLRVLSLENNRLGDAGAEQVARADHWDELQVLVLRENALGEAGVIALASAAHLARLQVLVLNVNAVGDAGAEGLADSAYLGALRHLGITCNLLGDRGGLALGRSTRLGSLRTLEIYGNALSVPLMHALGERIATGEVHALDAIAQTSARQAPVPAPPPLTTGTGSFDERALLAGIADDPDDDLPYLAYADWLEENGDPEWAELIRSRAAREGSYSSPRENQLVQVVRPRLGPLGDGAVRCTFVNGLQFVALSPRTFLTKSFQRHGATWLGQARVRGVILTGSTKHWDRVARSPVLAAVRDLELTDTRLAREGLEPLVNTLLASPHLAGLHTLGFLGNGLTDTCVEALARTTALPRLRRLRLCGNRITNRGLAALLAWPQVQRLTRLDLTNNLLQPTAAAHLANAPSLAGLRRLELSTNRIGNHGAIALARSPHLPGLTHLSLGYCSIDADGAIALAASPYLCGLHTLSLSSNTIGDAGVRALADSRSLARTHFVLQACGTSTECMTEMRARLGDRVDFRTR